MRKYTVATGKNQSITQQYRHNQHPFTVKLNPLQTNLYNTFFYLQVFWGLFSVSLHFQSWSVAVMSNLQLLGLFNCLPALFLSPLITTHPSLWIGPPSVCGRGYTNGGITHNLGSHTTLSQRWRTRSTINVTSFSTPEEITWAKNTRHSISEQEIHCFYITMYWVYMFERRSHQIIDYPKLSRGNIRLTSRALAWEHGLQIRTEMQFTVEQCIQEKNKVSQRQREVSVDGTTPQRKTRLCRQK